MLLKVFIPLCVSSLATSETKICENLDWEICFDSDILAKNYRGNITQMSLENKRKLMSMSAEVRRTIPFETNVRYGSREREMMDIYGGDLLPPDAPIYVHLFGGGWNALNNTYAGHVAKQLFKAGIRAIAPNYDLLPEVSKDTQRKDITEMANFVLALAEKNNSRGVWFGGHSSAGQSAAELMFDDYLMTVNETRRKFIKGFIIMSPIYDLTVVLHLKSNKKLHLTREEAVRHSPLLKVNQLNIVRTMKIPVVMTLAGLDSPGLKILAAKMLQHLMSNGVHVRLIYLPDEDHFTETINLFYSDYELTRAIISLISHDVLKPIRKSHEVYSKTEIIIS